MMKIPSKLDLLGRMWKIKKARLPDNVLGQTEQELSTITLSESMPEDRVYEVLLHELVHVAMLETGVDCVLEDKQKEAVCDCVALLFSRIVSMREDK